MSERERLIEKNEEIVSVPMPDLENMTNEQLRKRHYMLEKTFEMAFEEDDEE